MPFAPLLLSPAALIAAILLLGLALTINEWLRPIFNTLSLKRSFIGRMVARTFPFSLIAPAIRFSEHRVRSFISHAAGAKLPGLTKWVGALAGLVALQSREVALLAEDVYHGIDDLIHHRMPRAIRHETKPIDRRARAAERTANRSISLGNTRYKRLLKNISAVAGAVALATKLAHRGIDLIVKNHVLPRLKAAERGVANVGARVGAQGKVIDGIRSRDLPSIRTRLKNLEKWLVGGAITALIIRTLTRVAPWLFCRNVARLGRTVCALDSATVNGLIGLLLGTIALRDIRTLAQYAEAIEREMAEEVRRLVG
jgi:hypothetical protein